MTIDAVCPHCETTFHLQPAMAGTAMRCPECKEVFTVTAAALLPPEPLLPAVPPPLPKSPNDLPYERIESGPPILDAEPILVAKRLPPVPKARPLPDLPRAIPLADTIDTVSPWRSSPVPAVPMPGVNTAPQEVDWRDAAPPKATTTAPEPPPPKVIDFAPPKPPRNVWPLVLTVLILCIVLIGGGTVGKLIYDHSRQEDVLAKEADDAFKDRNYASAQKTFEQLLEKYPESAEKSRYEFFNALSALQVAMSTVTLKDDPTAGRAKWDTFLKDHGDTSRAKSDDNGYGADIFDAGRKLLEGHLDHATQRLTRYRSDYANRDHLAAAEKTVLDARGLLPTVERFRPKDVAPLDDIRTKADQLGSEFRRERRRLDVLAPFRDVADDPVEERIAEFIAALKRNGFENDSEATGLITQATTKLRSLLKATPDLQNPVAKEKERDTAITSVATPLGRVPPILPPAGTVPEVVFATARGRAFALDADTGDLLWSHAVGRAGTLAPQRYRVGEGGTELVLVASQRDGQPAITARVARSGELRWHQELTAAIAGPAVFIGSRLYVPLADAIGSIVELDSLTGQRISTFRLRQRIGPGLVRIPGTSQFLVVAEARRLFIIDAAPLSPEGDRLPPRLLHVVTTNHPDLSVKVLPVFAGATPDAGPKCVVLLQSEGTANTLVRALALPEGAPAADAIANETLATEIGIAKLPGLATFPPATDGERIAVATDTGHFACYAVNAPGNLDAGLYALPAATLPMPSRDPTPSLVTMAGEDTFWLFSHGTRLPLKLTFTPTSGLKLTPRGAAQPWGVPLQDASPVPRRNAVSLVERADNGDTARVVLMDPATGRVIWEKLLGIVATACGDVIVDGNGGVAILADGALNWIAPPVLPSVGPAKTARDTQTQWVLIPESAEGNGYRVRVRQITAGKIVQDAVTSLPASLAGPMIVANSRLLIALNDGFVYRFDDTAKKFAAGPMWRNPTALSTSACYLASDGDVIFASDGDRKLGRWRWPVAGEWTTAGTAIMLRSPVAITPLILETKIVVADASGAVVLLDLSRPDEPLRRWRPPVLPAGTPTHGVTAFDKLTVHVVGSRHIVALAPEADGPAWIIERPAAEPDLLGITVAGPLLYATDILGTVIAYDTAGKVVGTQRPLSKDYLPRAAATVLPNGTVLLPAIDGSLLTLPAIPFK